MKIVLANNNFPLYENTPNRKSFIKVENGVVSDDYVTMKAEQDKFMKQYFTIDESKIANTFNLSVLNNNERNLPISASDFGGVYGNDYEFFANVNYLKIIHDNGFIEYCYIVNKTCLNIPTNKWMLDLRLDVWNTYWLRFYEGIKKVNNYILPITRLHESRFDLIDYEGEKRLVYRFLNTQDTSFWNKEKFSQTITSNIPLRLDITANVWDAPEIPNHQVLSDLYHKDPFGIPNDTILMGNFANKGYAYVIYESSKGRSAWQQLPTFYGLNNVYFYIPIVNQAALEHLPTPQPWLPNNKNQRWYLTDHNDQLFTFSGNWYERFTDNPLTASIIITPKPIWCPNDMGGNEKEFPRLTFPTTFFPVRWRGHFKLNNSDDLGSTSTVIRREKIGPEEETASVLHQPVSSWVNVDTFDNIRSFANALCDERYGLSNDNPFVSLENKVKGVGIITNKNISLEPKLYDEELYKYEYTHQRQEPLVISPKWYFYQNWDDIFKWKAVYIMGYQFVQPHIVALFQFVLSGLYETLNYNMQQTLYTFFSPQQQTSTEAQKSFLISNRSQLNATLNIAGRNAIIGSSGAITGGTMGGIGGAIGGSAMGILGALTGGAFGLVKSVNSYFNTEQMISAQLEDLARMPNQSQDYSSESSFKLISSLQGYVRENWINEVDKYKIWTYHALNGYFYNGLMKWNDTSTQDLKSSSLATRILYNYWKIENIKNLFNMTKDIKLLDTYKEYFDDLFANGVTLWHNLYYQDKEYDTVGNYDLENWELELWDFVKNETV